MRRIAVAAALVLAGGAALAGPEASLTGIVKTKRFEVRFRPGSRAAADADRQAVAAERDLDRIAAALGAPPKGPFTLWLYDDEIDLADTTGVQGTGGYSAGKASHIPYGNDQTRLHELVHVVAAEWPASGGETRNLFCAEGLANAVLEFVHGVHVHAVAAFYMRAKRLPPLSEMTGAPDFYAWLRARPGFDAYDVAGSWFRFLLDSFGAEKVRRYYTGTPPKTALGKDAAALEAEWHAALEKYPLRPEVETLLKVRHGEAASFPDRALASLLARPEGWVALLSGPTSPQRAERWSRDGAAFVASNDADEWTACEFGKEARAACVVRVRVASPGNVPVQVRFGDANQVMFVANGTFLYRGDRPVASDPHVTLPPGAGTLDLVVLRRGKTIEAWLDGKKALTTDGATEEPALVGVGLHRGRLRFEAVSVHPL